MSAVRPKASNTLVCTCFERALISSTPKFWGPTIRRTVSATS